MGKRPLPPLPTLQAFCAIVETGGFGRAAERVGLTQTAISHQISQLEGWIGGKLFERGRTGAQLTVLGARLHPAISQAVSQLEASLYQARASLSNRALTLSAMPEFSSQWLAPRLQDFCRRNPDVEVKMVVGYRRPDFAAGGVDLAIWLGEGGAGLISEKLLVEEEFVVCAPEIVERLPSRGAIKAAPLLRYAGMRHTVLDWQRWYEQITIPGDPHVKDFDITQAVENSLVYSSLEEMLDACRSGQGFALVRSSLVASDLAARRLVRCFVEVQPATVSYNLIFPRGALQNRAAALFRNWLMSEAGKRDEDSRRYR
ncbi:MULTISPECIES: LysR substrate-binding domain-containing protein [unclassified Sinorhizobium]|uniref:LysR substrate-binding domain-containing protein n=1 Tax=unclassified Sinorhizobium TaxID=2613772 RepID=UPI00352556ED